MNRVGETIMINLAHFPEEFAKPNLCYMEIEGLSIIKSSYDQTFDMRQGMNANGMTDQIMLSK